jgi:hypothetical protein
MLASLFRRLPDDAARYLGYDLAPRIATVFSLVSTAIHVGK